MTDQQLAERIVSAVRTAVKMPVTENNTIQMTRRVWGVYFEPTTNKWEVDGYECACPLGAVLLVEQPKNHNGHIGSIAKLFERDAMWIDGFLRAVDAPLAGAGDNGTHGFACGELVMSILAGEWKDIAI